MKLIYDLIYQKSFLQPLWIMPFVKNKVHPFVDSNDVDCVKPKNCTYCPSRKKHTFPSVLAGVLVLGALLDRCASSQVKARRFLLQFSHILISPRCPRSSLHFSKAVTQSDVLSWYALCTDHLIPNRFMWKAVWDTEHILFPQTFCSWDIDTLTHSLLVL